MAEVTISTKVEAPDISSLQNLTKELKAAKSAALNGDGQAAKRVAELKDKIDDLKDATQTFQGSGVEKLKNSFGLLTDGFKNFDSDKVKIAFKGIGQAMSAVPIFLLVEGITALIENFDVVVEKFKEFFNIQSDGEKAVKALNAEIERQKDLNKAASSAYENEIKILEAQGASSAKIIAKKRELNALKIRELEIDTELQKKKIEEIFLNDSLIESTTKFNIALQRKLGNNKAADLLEKALFKDKIERAKTETDKLKENAIAIANLKTEIRVEEIKNDVEVQKKRDENRKKNIDESQKEADELFQQLSRRQDAEDKLNAEARKREKEAKEAAAKAEAERLKQIEANNIKVQEDAVNELKNVLALRVQVAEAGSQDQLNALLNQLETEKQLTLAKYDEGTEERLLLEQKFQSQKDQLITDYRNKQFKEDLQVATDGFTALQGLSDTYFTLKQAQEQEGTEEYERNAKKQFEINKALQLGTAVITGIQSILAITSVPDFTLGVATAIRIAAQVALNVASIAKIATTKYKSTSSAGGGVPKLSTGGGGGGNVNPSQPNIPAPKPQDSTQFDEQGNRINSQPIIVKVSEINDTQSRVARVKEQSVF